MVQYGVGVRIERTVELKRIDLDYDRNETTLVTIPFYHQPPPEVGREGPKIERQEAGERIIGQ